MKERPILFSAPMVRALLDGSKTQTRRIAPVASFDIKNQSDGMVTWHICFKKAVKGVLGSFSGGKLSNDQAGRIVASQFNLYGKPDDHLWVREAFSPIYPQDPAYNDGEPIEYDYRTTYSHGDRLGDLIGVKKVWKPSIFMPRAASRITLEITGVRIERLQDISEADAMTEGIERTAHGFWRLYGRPEVNGTYSPVASFRSLWESINGPNSWAANPWLWVIEFKVLPK